MSTVNPNTNPDDPYAYISVIGMAQLLEDALRMLRYYRSRMHQTHESDDGGYSAYSTVYGVHRTAIADTDQVLDVARSWKLLGDRAKFDDYVAERYH